MEAITRSKEFEKLEESTQNVIDAVLNNRSAFTSAMQEQTVEIRKNINEQHGKTRAQISITASSLGDRNNHQHEKTREELARMTREAGILRRDMEHQLAEIKELITAAGQARGQTQQIDLEAEANAAASSWAAKDHAYTEIMVCLTSFFLRRYDLLMQEDGNHWCSPHGDGYQTRLHAILFQRLL